jgi:hypothetical protein
MRRGSGLMRRAAAPLIIAALAVAIAGCGNADSGASDGQGHAFSVRADTTVAVAPALTKPEFLARVNDLCRRRWRPVLNAVEQTANIWARKHPRVSEQRNFTRAVRLSYFASIDFLIFDHILPIGAPPGERRSIEDVVGTMQEAVERGERQVEITAPGQLETLFAPYNRKAQRYGIGRCLVTGPHLPRRARSGAEVVPGPASG